MPPRVSPIATSNVALARSGCHNCDFGKVGGDGERNQASERRNRVAGSSRARRSAPYRLDRYRPRSGVVLVILCCCGTGTVTVSQGCQLHGGMTFEIASTNPVTELGIILAPLLGWRFTVAEFIVDARAVMARGSTSSGDCRIARSVARRSRPNVKPGSSKPPSLRRRPQVKSSIRAPAGLRWRLYARHGSHAPDLSPKVRRGYEDNWRSRIEPRFGNWHVARIDHQSIQTWVNEMAASGLSPHTDRWIHSVLKMTLDYAIDDGQLLSRNPSARTKFPPLRQPRTPVSQPST